MTDAERYNAYLICKQRGHGAASMTLMSNPPWSVCSFCGTHYRTETRLVEGNVPLPPNVVGNTGTASHSDVSGSTS